MKRFERARIEARALKSLRSYQPTKFPHESATK